MGIVTKTGDDGTTSLWSGERVHKDDLRLEAYGTIDELSSFLSEARHRGISAETDAIVVSVQRDLVRVSAELASTGKSLGKPITDDDVNRLMKAIEAYEAGLGLHGFVLPGSTPASSALDVARCVARRAERRIVGLAREVGISGALGRYVNRLSDLLFILARHEEAMAGKLTYA